MICTQKYDILLKKIIYFAQYFALILGMKTGKTTIV